MNATGNRVLCSDFPVQDYVEELFYECSTSAARCIEALGSVPIPELACRKNSSGLQRDETQWKTEKDSSKANQLKVLVFDPMALAVLCIGWLVVSDFC